MNLVSNAIKFSQKGDVVKLKCKIIESEADLSIKEPRFLQILKQKTALKYLEVQVKDTGIGIKEEEIPKLFKLFGFLESSKQINTKGIGLGLHITKQIVNMFKGDIICQSKFGIGTTFIFIVALIDQ